MRSSGLSPNGYAQLARRPPSQRVGGAVGSTGGFFAASVALPAIVVVDRDGWTWPPLPSGRRRGAPPRRPLLGEALPDAERGGDGRRAAVPGPSRPAGPRPPRGGGRSAPGLARSAG